MSERIIEPVLPMKDLQGIVIPGFFKPQQTLLGVVCGGKVEAIHAFKVVLSEIAGNIATAEATLADRRDVRKARKDSKRGRASDGKVLTAVAFTYSGLQKLTPGAMAIPSEAFQQGLAARSAYLGDPTQAKDPGSPRNWIVGGPGREMDALFVVAGGTRASVDKTAKALAAKLKNAGLKIVYSEDGSIRKDLPGHEHFGFDDGISQPGVRGRASDKPDDYVTDRHISAAQEPEHSLNGYPGQDLVWPGVLALGQPATSPDPLIPGILSPSVPMWTQNGSFLVFRRLRQDVGLFWRTMRGEARRLSKIPGFEGMTDEKLASRLVGRWPSGAPVNRVPEKDDKILGKKSLANNYFKFDSSATPLPLASKFVDRFPQAQADPAGLTCPWAAHIRKVNTRDSGSDMGARDSTYARRILRVGVPFGKPLKDPYRVTRNVSRKNDRGLLFLGIQASIEDQFEFLNVRWMGDPSRPKMPGGHDLLVGQNNAPGEDRLRKCAIFGKGLQQASVSANAQWIIPTGGGYFFVPSISALLQVIGK